MHSRSLVLLSTLAVAGAGLLFWELSQSATDRDPRPGAPELPSGAGREMGLDRGEGGGPQGSGARIPAGAEWGSGRRSGAILDPGTHISNTESARAARVARGRVLDSEGEPVAGARVRALGATFPTAASPGFATHTGDGGEFMIRHRGPGPFDLLVRASGFTPFRRSEAGLPGGGEILLETIVLTRGVTLIGRVLNGQGAPVTGAELFDENDEAGRYLEDPLWAREPLGVSGEGGHFRIDRLAAGPWRVGVFAPEHPSRLFDGSTSSPGQIVDGLVFRLEPGAAIRGTVAGLPESSISRWEVRGESRAAGGPAALGPRRAAVEGTGGFELRGLKPGETYRLWVTEAVPAVLAPARSASVHALAGDNGVRLIFRPAATLVFQVLDAATREPVTGFRVRAGFGVTDELTDAEGNARREHPAGRVRFEGLLPDSPRASGRLEIHSVGYAPYRRADIALAPGVEVDLGTVLLEPVAVVRISVYEQAGGNPVEGALVTLAELDVSPLEDRELVFSLGAAGLTLPGDREARRAHTDASGVALLTSFEGRLCSIRVEARGWAPALRAGVRLPTGRDFEESITLKRGGIVLVQVVEPDGTPVPRIRVLHRDPETAASESEPLGQLFSLELTTDAQLTGAGEGTRGVARFEHLGEGVHQFLAVRRSTAGSVVLPRVAWTSTVVEAGVQQSITIVLPKRCALAGRVRELGVRLEGARLRLFSPTHAWPLGVDQSTDKEGRYRFGDLEVGDYDLVLTHPERSMPHTLGIELRDGENHLDLDLPFAAVEGRVLSGAGLPLSAVEVSAERASVAGGFPGIDAEEGGQHVLSDANGFYRLRGVVPGVGILVRAYHPALQEGWSEPFIIESDETLHGVDLVLEAGGTIRADVVHGGVPANHGILWAEWSGEDRGRGVAFPRPRVEIPRGGLAILTGLRPGRWKVSWSPTGDVGYQEVVLEGAVGVGPHGAEVTVEADTVTEITLRSESR